MIMVDSLGIGIELYKKEKKMGRIYVTGDIHSEPDRFNTENFPEQKEMTRDDYVIICGDFGLVWSEDRESKRDLVARLAGKQNIHHPFRGRES